MSLCISCGNLILPGLTDSRAPTLCPVCFSSWQGGERELLSAMAPPRHQFKPLLEENEKRSNAERMEKLNENLS
jgi:hypothetical protein